MHPISERSPGSSNASPRSTLGVLLSSMGQEGAHRFLEGLQEAVQSKDANLILFVGGGLRLGDLDRNPFYDLVSTQKLEGLILGDDLEADSPEDLSQFLQRFSGLPVVSLVPGVNCTTELSPDSAEGMHNLVGHLVEVHSYRQLAFVGALSDQGEGERSYQDFCTALQAHGLEPDPALVFFSEDSLAGGRQAVSVLLQDRAAKFEALVATSELLAAGAIQMLQAQGLRVPQDVAVAGFEGRQEIQFTGVPLTAICRDFHASGNLAIEELMRSLDGENRPAHQVFPTRLVIRWSCGCLPVSWELLDSATVAPRLNLKATGKVATRKEFTSVWEQARQDFLDGLSAIPTVALKDPFVELWDTLGALVLAEPSPQALPRFLSRFEALIQKLRGLGYPVETWHLMLNHLRRTALANMEEPTHVTRLEDIFHQARMLLGEVARQEQVYTHLQLEQQEDRLQGLSFSLATLFNLNDLPDLAARHFPALGIERCWIAFFDSTVRSPTGGSPARMLLAYDRNRIEYFRDGPPIAPPDMAPSEALPTDRRTTLISMSLALGNALLGYLWIEANSLDGNPFAEHQSTWTVYTRLRNLLSSAIFRAVLIREREKAMQEISRLLVGSERYAAELSLARDAAENAALRLQSALQETEDLLQAAQWILGSTEIMEICTKMTTQIINLVQARQVRVFLLDHDFQRITLAMHNGRVVEELDTTFELLNQGLSGRVLQEGEAILCKPAEASLEISGLGDSASLILAPLAIKGKGMGLVIAAKQTEEPSSIQFNQHDVDLLISLTTQAATAIDNAQMYNTELERRKVAETLVQAGRSLTSSLKLQEVPARILEQLHLVVPFERGSLMLLEEDAKGGLHLRVVAQFGFPQDDRLQDLRVEIREGDVFRQVEVAGRPVVIDDITRISGWQQVPWLPLNRSWMGVPLFSKEQVIGMVSLTREPARAFSQDDALLVSTFALQAAISLENAGLYNEITRFNEQLEQMVEQRTEELNQALQVLGRMDRNKSDFINVAAHELRTPLTVMKGYVDMIKNDAVIQASPYLKMSVEGVIKGTVRLHEIINSMLDVARIDSQLLDLQPQPMALQTVIHRVYYDFEEDLKERQLTFELTDLEHLPKVAGDPNLMVKLFQAVIVNAVKYTPDGGVIAIRGQAVQDEKIGECVEIAIQDSGIGIDPEHHELIFEKFYQTGTVQLHSSGRITFKGGGPGLGLSIARGVVTAHGGRIWVESPGHDEERCPGSTFFIRLPVYKKVSPELPG